MRRILATAPAIRLKSSSAKCAAEVARRSGSDVSLVGGKLLSSLAVIIQQLGYTEQNFLQQSSAKLSLLPYSYAVLEYMLECIFAGSG